MLYNLYYFTKDIAGLEGFNVFRYITFRGLMAALTALLLSLMMGPWVIRRLLSLKIGQPIRTADEVHKLFELHGKKLGTPTMGGIMILGTILISTLCWARLDNLFVWLGILTIVILGLLGFADDYAKVVKKNSKGVSGKQKMVVQFGLSVLIGSILLYHEGYLTAEGKSIFGQLFLPFIKAPVIASLGIFSILFFACVMVGSSNAVNLTDGLDGLAIGCTLVVSSVFTALTYIAGRTDFSKYFLVQHVPGAEELAIMCSALFGAGIGFLWFNCQPAKMFMGDTGSLAIGGFLGYVAIITRHEFLLAIVGGVFVLEALSVILQVMSFKLTGKRIFAMSPLHHHFELKGWNESTVVIRFWILAIIFALLGLSTLKLR
ncbi:MAG: phospho-N-acetylmuramoyl-pentapeptide-transferase [Verrucomicrobiota bacterium]|nr:phospho-N-acetylmuramoyl-pentapeptide-transferase [Verrucomicrobiota bacterium]